MALFLDTPICGFCGSVGMVEVAYCAVGCSASLNSRGEGCNHRMVWEWEPCPRCGGSDDRPRAPVRRAAQAGEARTAPRRRERVAG